METQSLHSVAIRLLHAQYSSTAQWLQQRTVTALTDRDSLAWLAVRGHNYYDLIFFLPFILHLLPFKTQFTTYLILAWININIVFIAVWYIVCYIFITVFNSYLVHHLILIYYDLIPFYYDLVCIIII